MGSSKDKGEIARDFPEKLPKDRFEITRTLSANKE